MKPDEQSAGATGSTEVPHGTIDVEARDGHVVVRMTGEIDAALRDSASGSMALALTAGLPVLVDATDVGFIDSSGLAFLLQLHLAATEAGLVVTLRDPRRAVADLLAIIGMGDALHVEGVDDGAGDADPVAAGVPV